jgi:hypothetical protein
VLFRSVVEAEAKTSLAPEVGATVQGQLP